MFNKQLRVMRAGRITPWLLLPPISLQLMGFGVHALSRVFMAFLFTELLSQRRLFEISVFVACVIVTQLTHPLFDLAQTFMENRAGQKIKHNLRKILLTELDRRGPMRAGLGRAGKLQAVIADGIESINSYFVTYFVYLFSVIISGTVILFVIFQISWVIGLVLSICAVATIAIPRIWDKVLGEKGQAHWGEYANMNSDFIDAMMGMTTLKSFGVAEKYGDKLKKQSSELLSATRKQLRISLGELGLRIFMFALGPALGLFIAVIQIRAGQLDIGQLFLVVLLSMEVFRPLNDITNLYYGALSGMAAVSGISNMLEETDSTAKSDGGADKGGQKVESQTADNQTKDSTQAKNSDMFIRFENVSYTYIGADKSALANVTFSIAAGKTTAIVGLSGSGKSTALGVLMGFDRPQSGTVNIFGHDPSGIDITQFMTLVPQDPVIFPGTIREILLNANPNATEEEMLAVLRYAHAADLHRETENAEFSVLDVYIFENGKNLSGGQKQRLAIARALIRKTPILILDESTSALDSMTEHALLQDIRAAQPELTLLIVTHRIDTASKADQVIVMANAGIACSGAPTALLRDSESAWSQLVKAQLGEVVPV